MAERVALSYSANQVRKGDPDRFLTALFAPPGPRECLFALYAFNLEVARIPELVREPMMGQIRLQWWRDRLDEIYGGSPREGAETPQALAAAIAAGDLPRAAFESLLDAREQDLDPTPPLTLLAFEAYAEATAGELAALAARCLGAADAASLTAARHVGTAWAMIGHLRSLGHNAKAGRMTLPLELMGGATAADVLAGRVQQDVTGTAQAIAARAGELLKQARAMRREVAKAALPTLLLAPLAELHLRRLARNGNDPLARLEIGRPRKQLALLLGGLRGRY
jgi:phytoene synthase